MLQHRIVFAGYAFAKLELPAKEVLFTVVMMFQMIPIGLLLIPMYLNVLSMHLNDTYWGVILPGISAGSIVATVLSRSFFEGIPDSIFEAARIDGANEIRIGLRLADGGVLYCKYSVDCSECMHNENIHRRSNHGCGKRINNIIKRRI